MLYCIRAAAEARGTPRHNPSRFFLRVLKLQGAAEDRGDAGIESKAEPMLLAGQLEYKDGQTCHRNAHGTCCNGGVPRHNRYCAMAVQRQTAVTVYLQVSSYFCVPLRGSMCYDDAVVQMQTAVTAHLKSEQLPLFAFARQYSKPGGAPHNLPGNPQERRAKRTPG